MAVAQSDPLPERGRESMWVFGGLFLVWFIANLPAFSGAWWYADDFLKHEFRPLELFKGSLHFGRPGFGLLLQLFQFERPPDAVVMNRVFRLLQGAMHVGAGCVLYRMLRALLPPPGAAAAVIPFLLWGLNGEATLWRAASMYPAAALLSLGGMHWIIRGWDARRRGLIAGGGILCLAAALTNQAAVTAGLMGYLIVVGLRGVTGVFDPGRVMREAAAALPAFLAGAVLSALMARHYDNTRGGFADDWGAKWEFLLELTRSFLFFENIYYAPIAWLHAALLIAVVILWITATARRQLCEWGIAAVPLCLLAGFVVPYLPNLVVADSYPSLRIMYTAPLLLTAVIALAWRMGTLGREIRFGMLAVVAALGAGYAALAWENGREYRELYDRDVATARAIEEFAQEHGTQRVLVVDLYRMREPWVNDNPYGFRIMHAGNRYSVFLYHWAAHSFLRRHTVLEPVTDDLVVKYLEFPYDLPRDPSLQWHYVAEDDVVIVVPR